MVRTHADVHFDSPRTQLLESASRDGWIGIRDRRHHPDNTGIDDGLGARRSPPLMRARFKGHEQGGTNRKFAGCRERRRLGVGTAGLAGDSLEQVAIGGAKNSSDPRVGAGDAANPRRRLNCARHELSVARPPVGSVLTGCSSVHCRLNGNRDSRDGHILLGRFDFDRSPSGDIQESRDVQEARDLQEYRPDGLLMWVVDRLAGHQLHGMRQRIEYGIEHFDRTVR